MNTPMYGRASPAVAIVGAGIAGLACAEALQRGGCHVVLYEKGRQPGGRLATWHSAVGPFDHGATSFTATDAGFRRQLGLWATAGVVVADPERTRAWMGTPCMQALPAALAAGLDVRRAQAVAALESSGGGWRLLDIDGRRLNPRAFDAVVVALPAEQAVPLLAPWSPLAAQLAGVHSEPCWTVTAAWRNAPGAPALSRWPVGPLCDHPGSTAPLGPLACVRREDRKPGRERDGAWQRWVLTASAYWSAHNAELEPAEVTRHLLDDLARRCARPPLAPSCARAHRWRHAEVLQPLAPSCGWDERRAIGACGDAWHAGVGLSSVERAWLSGQALAQRLCTAVRASPCA